MNRILIVEDDKDISRELKELLENSGYEAEVLSNFKNACDSIIAAEPDLVLLDINIPYMNGEMLLQQLRSKSDVPVIMVTSRDSEADEVLSMSYGADDYITKPFEIREVLARIQVQLRHTEEKEIKESNLSFREMVLNKATFQVSIGGKILPKITRQEFAILELLLRNPKQVFSKEDIFEYAWDEPYMGETKTLDVHISNIRKKIKTVTSEEYIETVWGIGYRLHL